MKTSMKKNYVDELSISDAIQMHYRLLGHKGLGVTELRIFDPVPMVAYTDNEDDVVRLCEQMEGETSGIYVGVQPRPAHLFDLAPNKWVTAQSKPHSNCATDNDIEYITTGFWDIDVVSEERQAGHPASDKELRQTLDAALILSQEDGLALSSVICCSGNGHYVLAPIVPIPVDNLEVARKFKQFCQQIAQKVAGQIKGIKIDPVYNLSRVMRLMGTVNGKGQIAEGRSHRRAYLVTEPIPAKSMALHHMILNTEVECRNSDGAQLQKTIHCDLKKLECGCEFVLFCKEHPQEVSQALWFGLITNLAYLEGGIKLIHEISMLDKFRYDYSNTEQIIQRVLDKGYKPITCKNLIDMASACPGSSRFNCSKLTKCPARSPMYLATLHTIYKR